MSAVNHVAKGIASKNLGANNAGDDLLAAPARIWPRRIRILSPFPAFSIQMDLRLTLVSGICLLLALGISLYSLTVGELHTSLGDTIAAIFTSTPYSQAVINWRLPRVLLALLGGMALAVSGALFQSLTRNPLGSPDVIGFNTGAYTGVVLVTLLFGGSYLQYTLGAVVGGLLTAVVIYFLAFTRGTQGLRLILVGIGLNAMLTAFNTYILTVVNVETSVTVSVWGMGNLNTVNWVDLIPTAIALVVLLPAVMALAQRMRLLEMGDDNASSLGVGAESTRIIMVILGVVLTGVVTAVAGPIIFVALAAPQIARKLARSDQVLIWPTAAVGGLLLAAADLLAKTIIAPAQLPVGILTVTLGGAYLIWLIMREVRVKK